MISCVDDINIYFMMVLYLIVSVLEEPARFIAGNTSYSLWKPRRLHWDL